MSMEDVLLDKIKHDADFIQGAQLAYDVLWELWHEFGSQVP